MRNRLIYQHATTSARKEIFHAAQRFTVRYRTCRRHFRDGCHPDDDFRRYPRRGRLQGASRQAIPVGRLVGEPERREGYPQATLQKGRCCFIGGILRFRSRKCRPTSQEFDSHEFVRQVHHRPEPENLQLLLEGRNTHGRL